MEKLYKEILEKVGENTKREGLIKTPRRASVAMEFLTQGYTMDINKVVNSAIFSTQKKDMVIVKNIEFYSLCEHHMLPFYGTCSVGYIPNGKIIGLSKIPRIVDIFARRLQIQERLTEEIAIEIKKILGADSVIVKMEARHLCMMMRGVQKQNSTTITTSICGNMENEDVDKFLKMIQ